MDICVFEDIKIEGSFNFKFIKKIVLKVFYVVDDDIFVDKVIVKSKDVENIIFYILDRWVVCLDFEWWVFLCRKVCMFF